MKLLEAKQIVSYILEWQFICMGVKDRAEVSKSLDLSAYSLEDLIKANSIVRASNKRKEKIAKYHREKGHKVNGYAISMILSDRLIAGVYTAISFPPNGEMVVLIDDIGVGCVNANYKD